MVTGASVKVILVRPANRARPPVVPAAELTSVWMSEIFASMAGTARLWTLSGGSVLE